MKYLSVVFFAVALAWTWNIVHSKAEISFETHSSIQEKLAVLIRDTVKAKRPTATEIVVDKIWTEVIAVGKVKASFIYSFKDASEQGLITTKIHGQAILDRKESSADGNDQWNLSQFQTSSDDIEFQDATFVTGNPNTADTPTTPQPEQNSEQNSEEHQPSEEQH